MPNFTILLPASEGKQAGGNPLAPDMFDDRTSNTFNYFSELNPDRRAVIKQLHGVIEAGDDSVETILGVKDKHLEEAIEANLEIYVSPLMAALERYSPGVMYTAMDFAGLPTGAQRRLLENGVIFSGMFGLLRPDDLIPNYRLRMDASLPEIGKVSKWWKPRLSPLLNRELKGRFVWNLLPGVHQDAWDDEGTYEKMVCVKFYKEQNGERKAVTHNVKTLRGALVNFIVRDGAENIEALREWNAPQGFEWDEEATTWDESGRVGEVVMVSRG